jgi:hypothetical protein
MGLINSIGAWFEKITGGWTFGTQLFKLTVKGNLDLESDGNNNEHVFPNKSGTVSLLDDLEKTFEIVTQTAHGFTVGKALKKGATETSWAVIDGTVDAQEDFRGLVVEVIDVDTFWVALPGSRVRGLSGLTAGVTNYAQADGSVASTSTNVKVLFADTTTSGYLTCRWWKFRWWRS